MKAVVFIAVASIIVNTVKAVEPKQLNLALETVLQFDKKDRAADLAVLDKVQDFLDQIKNAMRTSGRRSSGNDITFTDFFLEAAKILRSLEDNDLEEAYITINDESRRYINTENELRELFDDNDMRRYVSEKLDDNKEMAADDLRRYIDEVVALIENKRETGENIDLLEIGNTLYDGASVKLRRALSDLEKMRRGNEYHVGSLLKSALRSLALLHYISLGDEVKTQLANMPKQNSFSSFISPTGAKYKPQSKQNSFSSMLFPSGAKNKPHVGHKQRHDRWHYSNKGKQKKNLLTSKHESTESALESTESEEKALMGGQDTRDLGFRAEITSKEFSRDREEDETSTEEILIQHSNVIDVGLSRKTPGRLNITFVSSENSRISDESRAIRKSNVNDTFVVDTNKETDDLEKMIKHIEEQIEEVKDQVEYVKNLAQSKRIENAGNRTENVTKSNRSFSFRAEDGADSSNSSETETNHNKTNENVTESISTNASDTTIANVEKEIANEENTLENSKNNTVDIDKSKKGESVEVNDTHNVNEDNHRQDETSMSPNEKDKAEDPENKTVVEVSNNSTAANFVEAGISAENRHDITE
ncbi:uncharacterized protein LOC134753084 [Cydia strobilella]|uniref:uncharacterized protein LOC134753084 n=1 Tax=Cydia strobilella TaxID=1100964 RepID=UPI003005253E